MGVPSLNGKFTMPMFKTFVPKSIQPWIYICIALSFQLSGGVYIGALNEFIGNHSLIKEDMLMANYINLAGMAITFPLVLRLKFRFTNKTLLCTSALGVIFCNIASMHITWLPILWFICFIDGYFKIQGTFECMSNIQLWMTPKRDFTVFFPLLHIIILCSIAFSNWITSYLTYYYDWRHMNLFIIGLMLFVLLVIITLTKHFRIMKKMPLYGIDWLGALLWSILAIEIIYLFNYGEFYNWWNSNVICHLTIAIIITAIICILRMLSIRHPFLDTEMWTYKNYWKLLLLIIFVEGFLAAEYVLEEIIHKEIFHYDLLTTSSLNLWVIIGVVIGCLFALLWMKVLKFNFLRLITIGIATLSCYMILYYFLLSPDVNIERMYLPTLLRGFSYAVLSSTFFVCLEEIMTFRHFFQSLCIFNMVHMFIGGTIGAAIYSFFMRYFMADYVGRYGSNLPQGYPMDIFIKQMQIVSIRTIYGWVAYGCMALLFCFLLYDTPIRSSLKLIPSWRSVGKGIRQLIIR